jgi:hypothetical protein
MFLGLPMGATTDVKSSNEDPLLRTSRREGMISLGVFVIALAYTIGYCTLYGYGAEAERLSLVLGVPSWVMWGIFLPWGLCTVFHCWFSVFVMQDHFLEDPAEPPDAEGVTEDAQTPH